MASPGWIAIAKAADPTALPSTFFSGEGSIWNAAAKWDWRPLPDGTGVGFHTAPLAADTVVALGRRILPKAETAESVAACLRLLSGRRHVVYTAVVMITASQKRERLAATRVAFKALSEAEIDVYVKSREGEGKAGGYAIQGYASRFITRIDGAYPTVVGLPVERLDGWLEALHARRACLASPE